MNLLGNFNSALTSIAGAKLITNVNNKMTGKIMGFDPMADPLNIRFSEKYKTEEEFRNAPETKEHQEKLEQNAEAMGPARDAYGFATVEEKANNAAMVNADEWEGITSNPNYAGGKRGLNDRTANQYMRRHRDAVKPYDAEAEKAAQDRMFQQVMQRLDGGRRNYGK